MTISKPESDAGLEHHAPAAAQRLRVAIQDAFSSIGANPNKPLQLSRDLGLDKSLGWKVSKLVIEEDSVAAIRHLPGRPGLKILREKLAAAGVRESMLERIDTALDALEEVIVYHAGDRDTFDLMITSLSPQLASERDVEFRRQAFQGNSAIWGIQARLQLSVHFVQPSKIPGMIDLSVIGGLIDLRRLRQDVSWAVARSWRFSDTGETQRSQQMPIDPSISADSAAILTEFSSRPLPPMSRSVEPSGIVRHSLDPGPIGNIGACSCVTGWYNIGAEVMHRTETERYGDHVCSLSTPVETLYHELYVHRSMHFAQNPELALYSMLPGGPMFPRDGQNAGRLHLGCEIQRLGGGDGRRIDVTNPDYPRHKDLIECGASALDSPIEEFVGFRVRVPYPPIPTMILLRYNLPEKA